MLDTLHIASPPISFPRNNRSQSFNALPPSSHMDYSTSLPKDPYIVTEDNWHEVLLTPENIINIKKPLSPPKRQESYSSLQDFLLNNNNSKPSEVQVDSLSNASPPPAGKSPSPEKTRWAGPAFCNSPAPKDLPKPSFHGTAKSPSNSVMNHRSFSLPVLPLDSIAQHKEVVPVPVPAAVAPPSSDQPRPTSGRKHSSKQFPARASREESYQVSPTKKKATYAPKHSKTPSQETVPAVVAPVPSPASTVQLEELSNQLKQMLNLKTA